MSLKNILKPLQIQLESFKVDKNICTNLIDLNHLNDFKEDKNIKLFKKNNFKDMLDLSLSLQNRLLIINKFYKNEIILTEYINQLCSTYFLSYISVLNEYLHSIIKKTRINITFKILCIEALSADLNNINKEIIDNTNKERINKYYETLEWLCEKFNNSNNTSTTIKIKLIKKLMKSGYKLKYFNFVKKILNNNKVNLEFRYKIILELIDQKFDQKYVIKSSLLFFNNVNNSIYFRLLCSQHLIVKGLENSLEKELLNIAKNKNNCYQDRANCCDILIGFKKKIIKEEANKILNILGENNKLTTIYENKQNVHTNSIKESCEKIIEFLINQSKNCKFKNKLKNINSQLKEFLDEKIVLMISIENNIWNKKIEKRNLLEKKLLNDGLDNLIMSEQDKLDEKNKYFNNLNSNKLKSSIKRIQLDRGLYTKFNLTLIKLLNLMYNFIITSKNKNNLLDILINELIDASGTCASGFVSRISNVISGQEISNFLSVKISIQDEIEGCLFHKFNKCIKEIKDDDIRNKVLEEMTITELDYNKRLNFLKYFRESLPKIKEELWNDYKSIINYEQFDGFLFNCIIKYTT